MKISIYGPLAELDSRSAKSWLLLRFVLAGLIAAHGWARFAVGGVVPFGEWLNGQGIPAGVYIAGGITAIEILGTPLFAFGRLVFPLSVMYAFIYFIGIILVHLPDGWFVVGLGRNGAEYSALLITCLLLVGWQHRTNRLDRHYD